MVSSVLQPEKIIGKQKPTKEQALKFVSGGSSLGSSVFSGAKNKIVNFDRAKVSAKPNNLQALISNLSTSVFNTTNTIQNIFGNKETKEKKSSKFFGGFFDKFKEALAFITFFGAKKNLDRVKENIDNLKTTFTETFDVAKALRKAILKIIEQISGLSGGGGGGGIIGAIMSALGGLAAGLVPGMAGRRAPNVAGPAMKQEGNLLSKIPKGLKGGGGVIGKLLLGGTAALGVGSVVNGLSQPGGEDVQPGDTAPEVPGNVLDRFNSILDRFDKILDGLKGKPGKSSGASSGSGSSSKPASPGAPPGGSPSPTGPIQYGPLPLSMSNKQAFSSIYELAKKNGDPMPELTAAQAMFESGYLSSSNTKNLNNPFGQSGTGNKGSSGRWAAYNSLEDSVKDHINKWQKDYKGYRGMGTYGSPLEGLRSSINAYAPASENNQANYLKAVSSILATMGFDPNKKNPIVDLSTNALIQQRKPVASGITAPTAPVLPTSPTKPGQQAPQAPSSSKPGPQPIQVIPFESPSSQVQPASSGGGGQISAPPSPKQNGPTAPFYPSTNYDNFLTLYSRMVYNIVDG